MLNREQIEAIRDKHGFPCICSEFHARTAGQCNCDCERLRALCDTALALVDKQPKLGIVDIGLTQIRAPDPVLTPKQVGECLKYTVSRNRIVLLCKSHEALREQLRAEQTELGILLTRFEEQREQLREARSEAWRAWAWRRRNEEDS